jgi:hypothetical protein
VHRRQPAAEEEPLQEEGGNGGSCQGRGATAGAGISAEADGEPSGVPPRRALKHVQMEASRSWGSESHKPSQRP